MRPLASSRPATAAVVTFVLTLIALGGGVQPAAATPPALLRIDLDRPLDSLGVPLVADLRSAAGEDYALALIPASEADAAGLSYTVLDPDAAGAAYFLALERRPGARQEAARRYEVLLDDGRQVVVRATPERADELAALGFDLTLLRATTAAALPRPVPAPLAVAADYNPWLAAMIDAVRPAWIYVYTGDLTGENPVTIGGVEYTITTRHTGSGTPIEMATQYVYEHLESLGLAASYQPWYDFGYDNRNVVGEMTGETLPGEIVLVTAHLDDVPADTELAPGADDNASGSVGVMIVSDVLSEQRCERTLRFVFFTGEEQGLLGAQAHAGVAESTREQIVGVLNMDMIAYDGRGGPVARIHTRRPSHRQYPADLALAELLVDVVSTYGLAGGLEPIIDADGLAASDHFPFWIAGYPAIFAIEDDVGDFNPHYHTTSDQRQYLNIPYFTTYVKAVVATAAHLASCTDRSQPFVPLRPNQLQATVLSPT